MSFKLDKNILAQAMSDEKRAKDIIDYLNEAVDNELDKPCNEMDAEFIDECIRIIEAIEEGDFESIAEEPSENEEIISVSDKDSAKEQTNTDKPKTRTVIRFRRILAVAAVLAIAITATLQAFPAIADDIREYFSHISELLFNAADEGEEDNIRMIQVFEKEGASVNTDIHSKDEIDLSGYVVGVWYDNEDDTEMNLSQPDEIIPLCKCTVREPVLVTDNEGNKIFEVVVSYGDNATTIEYNLIDDTIGEKNEKNQ